MDEATKSATIDKKRFSVYLHYQSLWVKIITNKYNSVGKKMKNFSTKNYI